MSKNEDWLEKVKEQIDNYEAPISQNMWSRIESDLPKKSPVILFLKRGAAAIASIAAVAAIIVAVRFANNNPQNALISSAKTDILNEVKTQTENIDIIIESQEVKDNLAQNITTKTRKSNTTANNETATDTICSTPSIEAITSEEADTITDQYETTVNNHKIRAISEIKEAAKTRNSAPTTRSISLPISNYKDRKWSISLAVNNGLGNRNTSANGFTPINNGYAVNKYTTRPDRKMRHFSYVYSSVVAKNIEKETKTEIEYEIPLTYAAMFRYHFNKHWAIDAGIQFSHLGASWHSGSSNSFYSSSQKLIFVGIPVGASFTFVDTRFFSMYAIAGGSFEKCAAGSINRFAQSGRKHAKTGKRDLPEHPWQFSLNAGLGLQFNATKHIGIFAEPKATRFFDTANELNLRKHDTEFQLLVGLRLTY